jgi:hypothetical protein
MKRPEISRLKRIVFRRTLYQNYDGSEVLSLRNEEHNLKRKRYGYGWHPASWQGWLAVALLLITVIPAVMILKDLPKNILSIKLLISICLIVVATSLPIATSLMKGPKLKW